MIDLNAKFFGFSLLTWIILGIIILVLSCTVYKKVSKKSSIEQVVEPVAKTPEKSVEQKQSGDSKSSSSAKVIVFYAKWCGFSKKFMGSDFKSGEWKKIKDHSVNLGLQIEEYTDEDEAQSRKYKVDGFPTVVFESGDNVKKLPGYRPAEGIISELEKFLA